MCYLHIVARTLKPERHETVVWGQASTSSLSKLIHAGRDHDVRLVGYAIPFGKHFHAVHLLNHVGCENVFGWADGGHPAAIQDDQSLAVLGR